jgi:hypothetical protein
VDYRKLEVLLRELLLTSLFFVVGCSVEIKGDVNPPKSDSASSTGSQNSPTSANSSSSDSLLSPPAQSVLIGACQIKTSAGEFGDILRLMQSGKSQKCEDYFVGKDSSVDPVAYALTLPDSCTSKGGVWQAGQTCPRPKSGVQVLAFDDFNGSRLYLRYQYAFQNLDAADLVFVKALVKAFLEASTPEKPAAATPDLK